jgi:hypothetical protein
MTADQAIQQVYDLQNLKRQAVGLPRIQRSGRNDVDALKLLARQDDGVLGLYGVHRIQYGDSTALLMQLSEDSHRVEKLPFLWL